LLISAFTIGLSVLFLKAGKYVESKGMLQATIALSVIFLIIKYLEWSGEFAHGIWPDSPTLLSMSSGANMYFGLYFTLTGLHALHVILGIATMLIVHRRINKGTITQKKFIFFENLALYWDYVHLVWVFVVPLFYMIGLADIGGHH
jgi:cytochrome c oxidase subunit 3